MGWAVPRDAVCQEPYLLLQGEDADDARVEQWLLGSVVAESIRKCFVARPA